MNPVPRPAESDFQHFRLLSDMGMPITEMELILDDPDLYPDEQVAAIAARLGFGDQFAELHDALDR